MRRRRFSSSSSSSMGLLVVLHLLFLAVGEASLVHPRLYEVHYAIQERRCELSVSWPPVQSFNACRLLYESQVDADGKRIHVKTNPDLSRAILVPLGKKAVFRVRTVCEGTWSNGEWFIITLPQNGTAGTEAIDVSCIWHNMQYVECSWRRGENASQDTIYNLTYWHHNMTEEKECTNYTKEGDTFRCSFHFAKILFDPFSVSIHGDSKDIQTVCMVTKHGLDPEIPIKFHPPSIVNIRKRRDGVILNWTSPLKWNSVCYEVEINNTNTKKMKTVEGKTTVAIPLSSNERHTFRVRAVQDNVNSHCKNYRGIWSEWSNREEWDERDNMFKFLLLILIPLCVTILTIILLVYLKRIKLLILPTIPDPGKFLKGMFEDQSEDLHAKGMLEEPNMDLYKQPAELPVKEEPTHLLIIANRKEN